MNNLHVLAFYLPQYHPVKENNEWWGVGFTEWTNVAKAKPLFKGHNQPRIPADLGFYDLRVPEVREQQAEMAKKAGVTAFCYWHYWFGNGRRLLERVFDEVLESGKPDFPFCLGWANHSWYAKKWNKDSENKLLVEQTYPGIEDAREHFNFLIKAFKDDRYIKIDNKPFLFIFDPKSLPIEYIEYFNSWAKEAGFDGIYLVANITKYENISKYLSKGYSSVLINRIRLNTIDNIKIDSIKKTISNIRDKYPFINSLLKIRRRVIEMRINRKPKVLDYSKVYPRLITEEDYKEEVIPQIVPQWDHTPRSGVYGLAWVNSTPNLFYNHVKEALKAVENKNNPIIILKSWNEWGEGNYMEPDLKYGDGFINALRQAIDESNVSN